jgi:hypothetical protein
LTEKYNYNNKYDIIGDFCFIEKILHDTIGEFISAILSKLLGKNILGWYPEKMGGKV